MTTLEIVKDIVTIIAASIASAVAIAGLFAWKKQLRGKNDYELVRRYLKSVYKLRNAIKHVRNPWIPIEESMSALKEKGFIEADYPDKSIWAVYSLRWEKVKQASDDLEVEALDAEVSWGVPAVDILKELYKLRGQLFRNVNNLIKKDKNFKVDSDILYDTDDDTYSLELHKVVKKIEDYLKPHLK